ncbi:MAG: restriction endonuclease [Nitrospirota bacterium]|nr:restriction endonuclease [Nitrospirota bacterium]
MENTLYYGDNLDVLKRYIKDESVDLIYLDPPFNSNQSYNVLFAEKSGVGSAAQIKAFGDTWHWDQGAALAYQETVEAGGKVAQVMQAFRQFLGGNDMLAYLSMMAPRLVELRRVLKSTGSIYLHCDPTASHYLKLLMDAVFLPQNFQNEIVWKRTSAHSSAKRYGPVHDVILFYGRSSEMNWIGGNQSYEEAYVDQRFRMEEERPWKDADLTGAGIRHGETGRPWRGFDVTAKGRHWAYPPSELDKMDADGLIYWPKKKGGWPRLRKYLDQTKGIPLQDIWIDVPPINSQAQERLGYPTQKPEALLERIINASSNEGDVVLDPFCGCGTATAAAQKLRRHWIGIDITHLAITLIKHRLQHAFGKKVHFKVIGEPTDLAGAKELAQQDPYQFQWWALGLVGARPTEQKKGADQGIDGRIYFFDEHIDSGKTKQIILSVKAGHTGPSHLRDLGGVVEREKAQIGILISLEEPTRAMRTEAAKAGFYERPFGQREDQKEERYPRLQLLTIEELLKGKGIAYPAFRADLTFKKAPKVEEKTLSGRLPFGE